MRDALEVKFSCLELQWLLELARCWLCLADCPVLSAEQGRTSQNVAQANADILSLPVALIVSYFGLFLDVWQAVAEVYSVIGALLS